MTKIDVFSGFLGAGKTTLIKKLLKEAYADEKVVLVENEFGEIGIDGGFLREAGIEITEMNSGCICCSLVGDFEKSLREVLERFAPDRVLIEPSGVGKLSDVVGAIKSVLSDTVTLGSLITVVDAKKCPAFMRNFGEFYNNQVEHADALVLSRTDTVPEDRLAETMELLRARNPKAVIVTTPWDELDGAHILESVETRDTMAESLAALSDEVEHGHHHHHGENQENCCCHHHHEHEHGENEHHHHHENGEECHCHEHEHHHEHGEECHCHEHEHEHHHEHGEECHCHEHEHHHEHGEECHCHEHGHHHHHDHHHADEVFSTFGRETAKVYSRERVEALLEAFDVGACGTVLRAKGILPGEGGKWIHFDYVPNEVSVREGAADVIGRLCVIGVNLKEAALCELFDA